MALTLQFLVLAATAVFWWLARRDLTVNAADARAPAVEDWAKLRMTVEQLMVELERRAVVAEQRIYEAELRLRLVEQRLQAAFERADLAPALAAAPASPAPLVLLTETAVPIPEHGALAAGRNGQGRGAPADASAGILGEVPPAAPPVPGTVPQVLITAPLTGSQVPSTVPLTAPLLLPGAAAPPLAVDMSLRGAAFVDTEPAVPALPAAERLDAPASFAAPPPFHLTPEEARYRPVYALADAGEADPAEIARQTGLPRGEVELVLSLRARRPV